jgi:hypothetical protein
MHYWKSDHIVTVITCYFIFEASRYFRLGNPSLRLSDWDVLALSRFPLNHYNGHLLVHFDSEGERRQLVVLIRITLEARNMSWYL